FGDVGTARATRAGRGRAAVRPAAGRHGARRIRARNQSRRRRRERADRLPGYQLIGTSERAAMRMVIATLASAAAVGALPLGAQPAAPQAGHLVQIDVFATDAR